MGAPSRMICTSKNSPKTEREVAADHAHAVAHRPDGAGGGYKDCVVHKVEIEGYNHNQGQEQGARYYHNEVTQDPGDR